MADDNANGSPLAVQDEAGMVNSPDNVSSDAGNLGGDRAVTVKLLLSNAGAASVIGKGGSTINKIQEQSKAKLQVSRKDQYFPGTRDRMLQLSGTLFEVVTALHLVLQKMQNDHVAATPGGNQDETAGEDEELELQLVCLNRLCGAIIGKNGDTIKEFMNDSGCKIRMQAKEQLPFGVAERLITVDGTLPQVLRAVCLIVTKMAEQPSYDTYRQMPLMATAGTALASIPRNNPFANTTHQVSVGLTDSEVGAVLGRGGKGIAEVQRVSGATVRVAGRGQYEEGTQVRKVTITGRQEAVALAQSLLAQRLEASRDDGGLSPPSARPPPRRPRNQTGRAAHAQE